MFVHVRDWRFTSKEPGALEEAGAERDKRAKSTILGFIELAHACCHFLTESEQCGIRKSPYFTGTKYSQVSPVK